MKPQLCPAILLSLTLSACFSPRVPATSDTEGGGETTGTSTSDPSGTEGASTGPGAASETGGDATSGTAGPADTGSSGGSSGPEILVFTANGVSSDLEVIRASAIDFYLEAEDDGELVSVEFIRNGDVLAVGEGSGGAYEAEWLVSGADLNGVAPLEAIVTDDDGNTAVASINADFDLPNGGLIEGWNFDNGLSASVYGIDPSPEGDDVVWAGAAELNQDDVALRVDRAEGATWQSTQDTDGTFGSDILRLGDGSYVVAGSFDDAGDVTTGLYRYSGAGTSVGQSTIDGAPTPGPLNWALGIEDDGAGRLYVMGAYGSTSSYLVRLTDALAVDWKRDITGSNETDGSPFTYDFDVRADGTIAVVGSRVVGTQKLWIGLYAPDGDLADQLTINSEFDTSIGYDVSWGLDGPVIVGTTNDGDGWRRLVRSYDDDLVERWSVEGAADGDFAQAVTVDGFGRTLVASTEDCEFNAGGGLFQSCRLVLRSHDEDGTVRWEHTAEDGEPEFNGPVLFLPGFKADVETDRYGYVYVSAQHRLPLGGDEVRSEWWMEKHHP